MTTILGAVKDPDCRPLQLKELRPLKGQANAARPVKALHPASAHRPGP